MLVSKLARLGASVIFLLFSLASSTLGSRVVAKASAREQRSLVLRCVFPDDSARLTLKSLEETFDVDIWRVSREGFDVRVAPTQQQRLMDTFPCKVWIPDIATYLDAGPSASSAHSLLKPPGNPSIWSILQHKLNGLFGQRVLAAKAPQLPGHEHDKYLDYPSMVALLEAWASEHSGVARFIPSAAPDIPTWEGRNISCISISSATTAPSKQILFTGGIHAREWIAPATVLYIIDEILQGYRNHRKGSMSRFWEASNGEVQEGDWSDNLSTTATKATSAHIADLLDNEGIEFILCPCTNPDGYTFAHSKGGQRLWRKNRRNNGLGSYGVDLNRNFPIHWGETGSSSLPFSEIYQGPSAGSEPETKALIEFSKSLPNLTAAIDFHSFGQLILRSWGFTDSPSRNEAVLKKLGDGMGKYLKGYTSERSAALYKTAGSVDDWWSAKRGIVGFTVELRDKGDKGFLLPPSEIKAVGAEAFNAAMFFAKFVTTHEIPPNKEP